MGLRQAELGHPLTKREAEIRDRICEGKTAKEICRELGIKVGTEGYYRLRVFTKLGAKNAHDLVRIVLTERYEGRPSVVDLSAFDPPLAALIKAGMA
jgi:DNA-binding CsgD family transcriptional regulator